MGQYTACLTGLATGVSRHAHLHLHLHLQGGETMTVWETQMALLHEASVHAAGRARRDAARHHGNAITEQAGHHPNPSPEPCPTQTPAPTQT